jgi:hypothetical protein
MRAYAAIFCFVTWLTLATPSLAIEPNAFLNQPAYSTAQLVRLVKKDPQVMDRYVRHFGISPAEVIRLFSALAKIRLDRAGRFDVYNVTPNGQIRVREFVLKAHTAVWANSMGVPILKFSCGNPMIWKFSVFTPEPVTLDLNPDLPLSTSIDEMMQPDRVQVVQSPQPEFEFDEPAMVTAVIPSIPDISVQTPDVIEESGKEAIVPVAVGGIPGWLGFLPGLIFLHPGHSPPPPIPEPSTFVGTGAALLGVAWRVRRRIVISSARAE